jgi:hypothetical protein
MGLVEKVGMGRRLVGFGLDVWDGVDQREG